MSDRQLDDEQIDAIAQKHWPKDEWIWVQYIKFAREVERAVLAAQQNVEPVEWSTSPQTNDTNWRRC